MSEMTFLLNDLGANIIRIEDEIKDYITDAI